MVTPRKTAGRRRRPPGAASAPTSRGDVRRWLEETYAPNRNDLAEALDLARDRARYAQQSGEPWRARELRSRWAAVAAGAAGDCTGATLAVRTAAHARRRAAAAAQFPHAATAGAALFISTLMVDLGLPMEAAQAVTWGEGLLPELLERRELRRLLGRAWR